jgi:hypothetical protein
MLNLAVDGVIGEGAMRVERENDGEKEGVKSRERVIHDEESSKESYSEAEGERAHAESQEMADADARARSLEVDVGHEHEMEITGIVGSVGGGMDVALDDAWIGEGMVFVGDSTFSGFPVIVEQWSAAPLDGE